MLVARLIVGLLATYAGVGAVFALLFVTLGVRRLDPAARDAGPGFRLLLVPGAAAFWPLLARRWLGGVTGPPLERNAHRAAARRDDSGSAPEARVIQGLRDKHRLTFTALAVVLPVVFLSGLFVRKPFPTSAPLPLLRPGRAEEAQVLTLDDDHLWAGLSINTRLLSAEGDPTRVVVELKASRDLGLPDALVYWSEVQPAADRLPERAVLLGALNGTRPARFTLPQAAVTQRHLILYSLARQQVIATATLPKGDTP